MKQKFLNYSLSLVKKYRKDIDAVKLDEIRYGLEGIYLTITKMFVIFFLAIIFNIFREMILLLLFFNILRTTGFGLHANKSWICLLMSIVVFVFLPYFSKLIIISFYLKTFLGFLAIILVNRYAPADTEKRPLVNNKKRKFLKIVTTISCTIMVIFSIIIKDQVISNLIILGIYTEVLLILPISYKIFNLKYNNYLRYNLD